MIQIQTLQVQDLPAVKQLFLARPETSSVLAEEWIPAIDFDNQIDSSISRFYGIFQVEVLKGGNGSRLGRELSPQEQERDEFEKELYLVGVIQLEASLLESHVVSLRIFATPATWIAAVLISEGGEESLPLHLIIKEFLDAKLKDHEFKKYKRLECIGTPRMHNEIVKCPVHQTLLSLGLCYEGTINCNYSTSTPTQHHQTIYGRLLESTITNLHSGSPNPKNLEFPVSAHLKLRHLRLSDQCALFSAISDYEVIRFTRAPFPYLPIHATKFIQDQLQVQPPLLFSLNLAIVETDSDKVIGMMGLKESYPPNSNLYEIGYWLSKPHWNKKIISTVLPVFEESFIKSTLLPHCGHDCIRLEASVNAANGASRHILEKNGFVVSALLQCGIERDGILYDEYRLYKHLWRDEREKTRTSRYKQS